MFEDEGRAPHPVVSRLSAVLDELASLNLDSLNTDDLLALTRQFERQRRRIPTVDHRFITEITSRGIAGELGVRDTRSLLVAMLRIGPDEATSRVRAAEDLGPRQGFTGTPMEPAFPAVAAALAEGSISDRHARVITSTIDRLPSGVAAEHATSAEAFLTEQATQFDPRTLAVIARRLRDTLDPDGTFSDTADHERRRALRLSLNNDGSGNIEGTLTAYAYASLQAVLGPLTKAHPTTAEGISDTRTHAQRQHDALHTACQRLLRAGDLPASGGTPATLLITMALSQLEERTGLATAGDGTVIPVAEALRHAADAKVIPAVLDQGRLIAVGHGKRLATATQRLALAARDGGCSHPGCDLPPDWCQSHHIVDWQQSRRTSLDDLTLVCAFHHLVAIPQGWDCLMIDGIPHWRAPAWLDPDRRPRRNTVHHLDRIAFGDP